MIVIKATAEREGFLFYNRNYGSGPLNKQQWTLEAILDQVTVEGEDTLEGAVGGSLGSLAGRYEGSYKLTVKSNLKALANLWYPYESVNQPVLQFMKNLKNLATEASQQHSCANCPHFDSRSGYVRTDPFDAGGKALISWEIEGGCEAQVFENGAMAFGVDAERLESVRNDFSGLTGKQVVVTDRVVPYDQNFLVAAGVALPFELKAVPNQKKLYVKYGTPYIDDSTAYIPTYVFVSCQSDLESRLFNSILAGGWDTQEYFWDDSLHSPWEIQSFYLSVVDR